jgi:predicted NBD/HSP70 family sugar kinase
MIHAPIALGIDVGGTSVKVAALSEGQVLWTSKINYCKPDPAALLAAVRDAAGERGRQAVAVGLCVPGILDDNRERVTYSANVPALHDIPLQDVALAALGRRPAILRVVNDTLATGADIYATRRLGGRLLVLALGTGVGAAVLDDGIALCVEGDSPGHLGQIDVSLDDEPVIGPDGGAGGLEGYIGAAALRRRLGSGATADRLGIADAPIRALVRAIRICHALYRPHHVVLAGGIGIRLKHLILAIEDAVNQHLTGVARPQWTLAAADDDHHAASGAARLASLDAQAAIKA